MTSPWSAPDALVFSPPSPYLCQFRSRCKRGVQAVSFREGVVHAAYTRTNSGLRRFIWRGLLYCSCLSAALLLAELTASSFLDSILCTFHLPHPALLRQFPPRPVLPGTRLYTALLRLVCCRWTIENQYNAAVYMHLISGLPCRLTRWPHFVGGRRTRARKRLS